MKKKASYFLVLLFLFTLFPLRPSDLSQSAEVGQGAERVLGLREAVELSLHQLDRTGPEIADWRIKEQEGRLWPELSLRARQSYDKSTLLQGTGGTSFGAGGTTEHYVGEIAVTYNLLQFLESLPRIREATAEKRASVFRLRSEEGETILRVSESYMTFVSRQEAIEALEVLRRDQLAFLRRQEARFSHNLISSLEMLRAQGDLVSLDREILSLRGELASAELNIRRLTGLKPEQGISLSFDPRELDLNFVRAEGLAGLLGLAKEVNPRLLAAEASVASARSGAEATQSQLYPTLSLMATSGYSRDRIVTDTVQFSNERRYGVFLNLNVPLFDWGVRQARVAQARLREQSQRRQASRTAEEVKTLIESQYWSFMEREQSRELLERQVRLANDELKQSRVRIEAGFAPPVESLFALDRVTRLTRELARTKAEAWTRGIRLAVAAGRSPFTPSLPSPAPRLEDKPILHLASFAASNRKSTSSSSPSDQTSGSATPATQEHVRGTEAHQEEPILTEPRQPARARRTIREIRVAQVDKSTMVSILGDSPIVNYKAFKLDQPSRFVIDLPGVVKAHPLKTISVKSNDLKQIRIGQHPDKIRVVLDLPQGGSAPGRIVQVDNSLQIVLGENQ